MQCIISAAYCDWIDNVKDAFSKCNIDDALSIIQDSLDSQKKYPETSPVIIVASTIKGYLLNCDNESEIYKVDKYLKSKLNSELYLIIKSLYTYQVGIKNNDTTTIFIKSIEPLNQLISKYPASLWVDEALYIKAMTHRRYSQNHTDSAMSCIRKIITDYPTSNSAPYAFEEMLSYCLAPNGDLQVKSDSFPFYCQRFIEICPEFGRVNRGYVEIDLGNHFAKKHHFKQAHQHYLNVFNRKTAYVEARAKALVSIAQDYEMDLNNNNKALIFYGMLMETFPKTKTAEMFKNNYEYLKIKLNKVK